MIAASNTGRFSFHEPHVDAESKSHQDDAQNIAAQRFEGELESGRTDPAGVHESLWHRLTHHRAI